MGCRQGLHAFGETTLMPATGEIPMWQVLIVEDDPQMRDFFAASIVRSASLSLAGCVGTIADALAWLTAPGQAVDVLLVDLGLPDGSGLDVIRATARLHPECEALVISMFGDEDNVLASIEAGALGYIHKDSNPEDIATSVLEMKGGASPISPMIARRVLAKYLRLKDDAAALVVPVRAAVLVDEPSTGQAVPRGLLSQREHDVLDLVARGFSYGEIARLRSISVSTVHTHIKNLYRKLAVSSRTEAVYEAKQMGLL